jgi:hypothetical protein
VRFSILFVSLFALSLILGAQEQECPHFSGSAKNRVEKQARWLVSESLQERVAQRSSAFGHLIKYEQCHILKNGNSGSVVGKQNWKRALSFLP